MGRRLSALLALAVAITVAPAASAKDPLDEQQKLTRADNALAAQVVLRPSDLPAGFVRKPVPKDDDATCTGEPDLSRFTITGKAERVYGHESGLSVAATTSVFQTATEARADFAASSDSVERCLRQTITSEGAKVTTSRYTRNLRIGDRAVHLRVDAIAGSTPVHIDLYATLAGRVQVVFMTFAPLRAPTGQEVLVRLMTMRAAKTPAA
jgi:hypothetical protein